MAATKTTLTRFGGRRIAGLIRHIRRTSQSVCDPPDLHARLRASHPCIVATWHGQFMMTAALDPGDVKVAAMVARHGDAELIGTAMEEFGVELIRGAGAGERKRDRGGVYALRASVKALKEDYSLVMTADIPPGPARVAGLGIIMIAKLSGRPICPVAAATSRFASLDTWSRMTINLPSKRLALVGAAPVVVPEDADATTLEEKRLELESKLNAAMARAYELAGADIKRATPLDQLAAITPPEPSLGLKIYRTGMTLLQPAVPALLNARGHQGKEDPARRGERLGFAGRRRPDGQLIWVHAASVGETNAVLPIINALIEANPSAHVMLTTGTLTSAEIAAKRLPDRAIHQYVPLDVPRYVERFLEHWRPNLAIFTESDIWPNLVLTAARRGVPLVLVNARMSPRSQRRWRKFGKFGRPLFSRFSAVLAQNADIARTIKRLGAPNVIVAGNLKMDAPPPPVDREKFDALKAALGNRPVLFAASTHQGEETIVAAAHALLVKDLPNLLTIIAPRHPDRGGGIAATLGGLGLKVELRSRTPVPDANAEIYVADTIGELGTFYALSKLAVVGGSLVEHGGQNPVEAIRHGTVVLTGPHTHNFRDVYAALLRDRGAIEVRSSDDLARVALQLLTTPADLERAAGAAQKTVDDLGGALAKTLGAIQPLLEKDRK